jgi:hypothetical protein
VKIADRRIFQHESGKEVLTFLSVESTFLDQKIEAVVRIREAEEDRGAGPEEVFSVEMMEPPAYFAWAAEQKIGTPQSVWKDVSGAVAAREIQPIPIDAVSEGFARVRRDLLDSAEQRILGATGIPRRLLEGGHDG